MFPVCIVNVSLSYIINFLCVSVSVTLLQTLWTLSDFMGVKFHFKYTNLFDLFCGLNTSIIHICIILLILKLHVLMYYTNVKLKHLQLKKKKLQQSKTPRFTRTEISI